MNIEDIQQCQCGALTVYWENGTNTSMTKETFDKEFPNTNSEPTLNQACNCNHCVNHWGIDLTFACHKTTIAGEDWERAEDDNTQHCAGAMIMMEKTETANQMMRLGERFGFYDRDKLDMTQPVFDTKEQFIKHHT